MYDTNQNSIIPGIPVDEVTKQAVNTLDDLSLNSVNIVIMNLKDYFLKRKEEELNNLKSEADQLDYKIKSLSELNL